MMNIAQNRSLFRRSGVLLLALGVAVAGLVFVATPAQALPLTVAVTITRVGECCPGGPIDLTSPADFYGRTTVGTTPTSFGEIEDQSLITPNWRATAPIEHTAATVTVQIEIFDEDDGLNFIDNRIDLTNNDSDRNVNITIDLHPNDRDCAFTGDAVGNCNDVVSTHGNADDGDVASLEFKVEVTEPAQAPGRHVRCGHTPLWPQAGQQVTITAESFGDQPNGQALPPLLADRVEVWYSTDGGATRQIVGSSGRQTAFSTMRIAPGNGSTISYGCRVVDGGVPVYSGWRSVQIGDPPQGRPVPVLLNSDREHTLDIVLFPAIVNALQNPADPAGGLLTFPVYTGAGDPTFQTAAANAVAELYREQIVLDNQRNINIWLARDGASTGGARDLDGNGTVDICQHTLPAITGRDYGFANVKAILHPATLAPGNVDTLRECAIGGTFSAEATETGVFIHETGHAGWGLADEYAPDGGYFEANPFPNTFLSLGACTADVVTFPGGVAADCRGMDSVRDADANPDFWVSDPASNDLMTDNRFARRADERRMKYVFELCDQAKC